MNKRSADRIDAGYQNPLGQLKMRRSQNRYLADG
jgi:hypothetical protein